MEIGEEVLHRCIASSLSFRGNIESKVLILVTNGTHHCYATSSRWRYSHSDIVIFWLPDAGSGFPQMRWCFIEVHYFSAFRVELGAFVNEVKSLSKY